MLAALGGGYFVALRQGWIGKQPSQVAASLTDDLRETGASEVSVSVGDDFVATLSGELPSEEKKAQVLALAQSAPGVASVTDELRVVPDAAALRTQVAALLQEKGFTGVTAEVADDRTVRLSGTLDDPKVGAAASEAVRALPGVASVSESFTQSPAYRSQQLNEALQSASFTTVTASVGADGVTTLAGVVPSAADKERAQQLVTSQQGALAIVRNDIVVAGPAQPAAPAAAARPSSAARPAAASQPAAAAQPAQPAAPRAHLAGLWVGVVKGTLLSYNVNMRLKDAGVGQLAGDTSYSLSNNVQCSGRMVVASITPELVTLNEELTQASLPTCQFGGQVKMAPQADGTYYVEWMSRTRQGKVAYKGTLHREQ